MNLLRSTWPIAMILAGCAVTVTPASLPKGEGAGKAVAKKPAAKASPKVAASTAPAASGVPTTRPSAAAVATTRPAVLAALELPTRLLPKLPASLIGNDGGTLIGNDGGTLIGNDGGTLIGNDGGTLIGNDGGTLIGNDGGSYRLAQAPTAEPTCGPVDLPANPQTILKNDVRGVVENCRQIEFFLARAAKLGLELGVPEVDERPGKPPVSYLLEAREQGPGGRLYITMGREASRTAYLIAVAFDSKEVGEAAYRIEDYPALIALASEQTGVPPLPPGSKGVAAFRMAFDFRAGTFLADSAQFLDIDGYALRGRRQLHVTELVSNGPEEPTTRLVSATAVAPGMGGCAEDRMSMYLQYLPDERATFEVARANAPGMPLLFLGPGGVRDPEPSARTGALMGADGIFIEAVEAAALVAKLKPAKDLLLPVPPLVQGDMALIDDPLFRPD